MQPDSIADRRPLARRCCGLALMLLFTALCIQKIWDHDLGWQLRTGEWIAQHRAVPRHNFLSYFAPEREWIEMRWLYCLALYSGWQIGGPVLLICGKTALLAASFLTLVGRHRAALGAGGLLIVALALVAAAERFVVRPELVTFVCLSLLLAAMDRQVREASARFPWMLVLMQIVWVNSHTLFALGPIVCWLFLAGDFASPNSGEATQRRRRLGLIALAMTGACLVNPYGLRGLLFAVTLWREIQSDHFFGEVISEIRSPFLIATWNWELRAIGLLSIVSLIGFVLNRRRFPLSRLLVWGAMLLIAGLARRNTALLAIVSLWATLANVEELRAADAAFLKATTGWNRSLAWPCAALFGFAAWYVATDRAAVARGSPQEAGFGLVERNFPRKAAAFLLDANPSPQLFHSLGDGSYLAWGVRDRFPVFIDGRMEVYGPDLVRTYLSFESMEWEAFSEQWGINTVLLRRGWMADTLQRLLSSKQWALVYLDATNLVFVRDIPAHAALIREHRIDPSRSWEPAPDESDEQPGAWRRVLGAVGTPWRSLGLAETFLMLGSFENARRCVERGLERFPDHPKLRVALAALCRADGDEARARTLLAGLKVDPVLEDWGDRVWLDVVWRRGLKEQAVEGLRRRLCWRPGSTFLLNSLGRLLLEVGRGTEAMRYLRLASQLAPEQAGYLLDLARGSEATNRPGEAVRHYRRLARMLPDDPRVRQRLEALEAATK